MGKLSIFLKQLKSLTDVMRLFASSEPTAIGLVFGSITFLLELASHQTSSIYQVLEIFTTIGELIPRFDSYPNLSPNSPRVSSALVAIYSDIIAFCGKANTYYKRNTIATKSSILLAALSESRPTLTHPTFAG